MRVCFLLNIDPAATERYVALHREVWPEMKSALVETGWRNYSLFLGPDGLLVGYLECDDFAASVVAMNERDVNSRWQALMAPFFVDLDQGTADRSMVPLPEIFHLD